ncbi:MAG: hypothetical protein COY22_01260 [Candidatus Tagabacteria bacterium CG_4_10_14_0_2_um_filter_40_13]|uniref:Uncharacterized protein n=2 Tax=Candidatus Tagaibacteriota TaxID=1817918 RepID=A0A2M7B9B9_9BACT|nr:MAG: hypothetical protein COV90_00120 [Candidatus Tagabacteria bacterium CG11_big_fil_rev_8_21_14_0_20_41_11]PIU99671.1 MAG: hypothetical protein COS58_01040 [Candidatus Tagabacteria bacterium CG03_land_8_20_14_0_80_41_22]PIZ56424.1 MAG: hypothetical protein COY22_01260 [Candidatus Tagabacteria bacterium CG_4_10_14_0_2_um_filter_40_13]PJC25162.1 MAG: hypothetical protein CO056_01750 [Candidatus Tagabacteria bacterium CG_4_9_14_0_2_um_filter_41_11]
MNIVNKVTTEIINPIIEVLFVLAIAIFFWGIIEFIWNSGNEDKRTTGKQHIIWGLFGLFIMAAVAGIIEIIKAFVKF